MKIFKNGTLRFWGDWFGRPSDNYHKVVAADYDTNKSILVIRFDNEEKCIVYEPIDIISNKNDFHIAKATKIVWEWYLYDKERTPQNLCKIVYSRTNDNEILKEYSDNISNTTKYIAPHNYYALEIC